MASPLDRGALEFADDRAAEHHQRPVAQASRCRSSSALIRMMPTPAAAISSMMPRISNFEPMSMPMVGSSMMKIFGLRLQPFGDQHLLLVAAAERLGDDIRPGRPHPQPLDAALGRSPHGRLVEQPEPACEAVEDRQADVLVERNSGRMPSRSRSLVSSATPCRSDSPGSPSATGAPFDRESAAGAPDGLAAEDGAREFGETGAGQAGDAEHLAAMQVEGDARSWPRTLRSRTDRSTSRRRGPRPAPRSWFERAADHALYDRAARSVAARGVLATTAPSRNTVMSSQTSNTSAR